MEFVHLLEPLSLSFSKFEKFSAILFFNILILLCQFFRFFFYMSLAFLIFPTLLGYNRHITVCNFKVCDTLIWCAYPLQFDYHCSATMISLNTFLFLPTPALLVSNDTKVRSFVIVPQVPKVLFIFSSVYFISIVEIG